MTDVSAYWPLSAYWRSKQEIGYILKILMSFAVRSFAVAIGVVSVYAKAIH